MMNWQLSDFLIPYPSLDTPGFQTLISAKKEFNELASDINEKRPAPGEPYKHQLFFRRYMSIYNDILVMDETGTGKTCELVGLTEYTLDQHLKLNGDLNVSHIKKTIVLVKSESLIKEFKKQLVCVCTSSRYQLYDKNISQKKLIKKKLEEWYEFYTYEIFAKKIKSQYEQHLDKLNIDYDHSIIICDEAHNLFVDEDGTEHQDKKKDSWNKEKTYHYLWLFYHQVQYSKRILSSATPMLNGIEEFGKLLNLILPTNQQLPVSTSIKDKKQVEDYYKNVTLEELEPYLRGRITYVRAFDTGATRVDQVSKIKCPSCPKTYTLYYTRMSPFQTQMYKNILETKGGSSYSLYLNNASNFVFPDGSIDKPESQKAKKIPQSDIDDIKKQAMKNIVDYQTSEETEEETSEDEIEEDKDNKDKTKIPTGYSKYVIELKGKKPIKSTVKIEKKKGLTLYQINKEAKPPLILKNLLDVQKLSCKYAAIIQAEEEEGSSFIYGRYNKSSGNIMLSLCFEQAAGYERYMETSSVFIKKQQIQTNDNLFCGQQKEEYKIKDYFVKKPRYALLTSDTVKNDAAFNSIMELMNSYENRHGEYLKCVIASRVVRDGLNFKNIKRIHLIGPEYNTSSMYQAISRGIRTASHQDLLNELIQQGFDPKLDIQVYLHAALPDKTLNNLGVDVHIYHIAYDKQVDIDDMMRKAKQCSIGCQIHEKRNIRATDINPYQCVDPHYTTIDYSTYNAYFLDDDVQKLIPILIPIIQTYSYFKLDDLLGHLNDTPTLILTTLEYIILNKIPLINTFGYTSYLYYDNSYYYLDRSYDVDATSSSIYYQENLIAINNKLNQFVKEINVTAVDQFIQLTTEKEIEDAFYKLSIDNQILFLEQQYIDQNPKYNFLLKKYIKLFYTVKQIVAEEVVMKETKRGRPSKTSQVCPTSIVHTNQDIVVHLLDLFKNTNKHSFISAYLDAKINIKLLVHHQWINANECENSAYQEEIKKINNNHFIDMQQKYNNLFGIQLGPYFWIVYGQEIQEGEKRSKRSEARGRDCTSYKVGTLQEMAVKLKIKKPEDYTREQLCPLIETVLVDTNRIF